MQYDHYQSGKTAGKNRRHIHTKKNKSSKPTSDVSLHLTKKSLSPHNSFHLPHAQLANMLQLTHNLVHTHDPVYDSCIWNNSSFCHNFSTKTAIKRSTKKESCVTPSNHLIITSKAGECQRKKCKNWYCIFCPPTSTKSFTNKPVLMWWKQMEWKKSKTWKRKSFLVTQYVPFTQRKADVGDLLIMTFHFHSHHRT